MRYVRKIATAALAGAVAAGLASVNRKAIEQILSSRIHKRQIEELRVWFESELQDAKRFSDEKSTLFVKEYHGRFTDLVKDEEDSEAQRTGIRELIWLNQQAQVTREYGIRLYPLSTQLGYEKEQEAARLMARRDSLSGHLSSQGYPVGEVYEWLRSHKRT